MLICDTCANIRGILPAQLQDRTNCELCGEAKLCSEVELASPASAFGEKGFFNSKDLSQLLALIKSRKAVLLPRIKFLQTEISRPMEESKAGELVYLTKCMAEEGLKKKTVQTCHSVFKRMVAFCDRVNPADAERGTNTVILNNLLAELQGLNEKDKELSILYKNTLDHILLQQLRFRMSAEQFNEAFEESKEIYRGRNFPDPLHKSSCVRER